MAGPHRVINLLRPGVCRFSRLPSGLPNLRKRCFGSSTEVRIPHAEHDIQIKPVREQPPLQKTVLYDFHAKNGGKLVPFGGFSMPLQYPDGGPGTCFKGSVAREYV
jgi:hypothetical protein